MFYSVLSIGSTYFDPYMTEPNPDVPTVEIEIEVCCQWNLPWFSELEKLRLLSSPFHLYPYLSPLPFLPLFSPFLSFPPLPPSTPPSSLPPSLHSYCLARGCVPGRRNAHKFTWRYNSMASTLTVEIKQFHSKSDVCLHFGVSVQNSLGAVVILPLVATYRLLTSSLKQLLLDQTRQNGYQTVPFCVYIHNLMFVCILG